MVFCVPGIACMYHYVFCDNKRIWIKEKKILTEIYETTWGVHTGPGYEWSP